MKSALSIFPILFSLLVPAFSHATDPHLEKNGIVSFEIEDTDSELGQWAEQNTIPGFSGNGYLEFTGNTPTNGPPNSPLTYRFTIQRGGLYYFHLRCARETVDGRTDLANDAYIRLEGDFDSGPNFGDEHGSDAPLEMLQEDTKFFGGADQKFVWASGNRLDPGGHENKRVAIYRLKAGATYTFTISGRSQRFKADRALFRHEDISAEAAERRSE